MVTGRFAGRQLSPIPGLARAVAARASPVTFTKRCFYAPPLTTAATIAPAATNTYSTSMTTKRIPMYL